MSAFVSWTPEELKMLIERHSEKPNKELRIMLGSRHSHSAIRTMACRLGLHKSKGVLAACGRDNRAARDRKAAVADV